MEVFFMFLDVLLFLSYSKNVQKIVHVEEMTFFSQSVVNFSLKNVHKKRFQPLGAAAPFLNPVALFMCTTGAAALSQ